MLRFQVQGSARLPYTVTAEGHGETFRMFCTCPAGRKSGRFCKHAAALLVGDVTKLVGTSEGIEELARMAQGSGFVTKAIKHQPADEPDHWAHIETLEDVVATCGDKLKALGYDCEILRDAGDLPHRLPRVELQLFAYFKNGKRRKTPTHVLYYARLDGDAVWEPGEPQSAYKNIRERQRPWGFAGKTKSTLSKIIPDFMAGVGLR